MPSVIEPHPSIYPGEELGQQVFDVPVFYWRRHRRHRIEELPATASRPRVRLPGETENLRRLAELGVTLPPVETEHYVMEGDGEDYEPLRDTPEAYLAFAGISGCYDPYSEEPITDKDFAETRRKEAAFIYNFGLPTGIGSAGDSDDIWNPPRGGVQAFSEAQSKMALTVQIASALLAYELDDDDYEIRRIARKVGKQAWDLKRFTLGYWAVLAQSASNQLTGVHLVPQMVIADGKPKLAPFYTCDTLLTAMWLQLFDALSTRKLIRWRCQGCNNPFIAPDRRKKYCKPKCRQATGQRRYAASHPKR